MAVIVGLFIILIIVVFVKSNKSQMMCLRCEDTIYAVKQSQGSIWIEIVLWLCMIVPGLIYSIWRTTSKKSVCPACGSSEIVPIDSPAAKRIKSRIPG